MTLVHRISFPPLPIRQDDALQCGLEHIIDRLGFTSAVHEQRLGIALVDISNGTVPRYAGVNHQLTMYAASLPKIAILLGLFKQFEMGILEPTERHIELAQEMIRYSSNTAATELFYLVGPAFINNLLTSSAFGLYDTKNGGGLWVGKEYGKGEAWARDPLKNLSHAASAGMVARFYYLLETGQLISPKWESLFKQVLSEPGINHKFVKGFSDCCPDAVLLRKSGSWGFYHSDSAIIYQGNKRYILVALVNDPNGSRWLEELALWTNSLIQTPDYYLENCPTF